MSLSIVDWYLLEEVDEVGSFMVWNHPFQKRLTAERNVRSGLAALMWVVVIPLLNWRGFLVAPPLAAGISTYLTLGTYLPRTSGSLVAQ